MRHPALVCSMLVLLTAWTSPAAAEWFVDLYLGLAATQSSDIETNFPAGVTTTRTLDGAEERHGRGARRLLVPQAGVDRGAVRHRYRRGARRLGLLSCGRHDRHPHLRAFHGAVLLPEGRRVSQGPLAAVCGRGPGIFVSSVNGTFGPNNNVTDTSVDLGFDFRAGAAFRLTELFSLFAEYRFTHVRPEFSLPSGGGTATSSASFNTHHVLTGVGFRF